MCVKIFVTVHEKVHEAAYVKILFLSRSALTVRNGKALSYLLSGAVSAGEVCDAAVFVSFAAGLAVWRSISLRKAFEESTIAPTTMTMAMSMNTKEI